MESHGLMLSNHSCCIFMVTHLSKAAQHIAVAQQISKALLGRNLDINVLEIWEKIGRTGLSSRTRFSGKIGNLKQISKALSGMNLDFNALEINIALVACWSTDALLGGTDQS